MGVRRRTLTTVFTLAAGAIAGVLFAPKTGRETRRELTATTRKVKRDVARELARLDRVSKATYEDVVSRVLSYYKRSKTLTEKDARELKQDLIMRWHDLVRGRSKGTSRRNVSHRNTSTSRKKHELDRKKETKAKRNKKGR